MASGYAEARNKKRDKFRRKKENPYKTGGKYRTQNVSLKSVGEGKKSKKEKKKHKRKKKK